MNFCGWMLDVAREQSPSEAWLTEMISRSAAVGYNSVGLYFEHRYAYPSAPWAAAPGAVTPEVAARLVAHAKASDIRLIPFLNTLGHLEGFIRSEGGQWLAEGPGQYSLQMCATRPECVKFARDLVADAMQVFDDEWVHVGGDETKLLGYCPLCSERTKDGGNGKLWGEYYGALCKWVIEHKRRPAVWGDMLLKHPDAMDYLPKETLIFDWQYFNRPAATSAVFRKRGFDVICCPSVQTYNSGWCFLDLTQENIDQHAEDAKILGASGVLVTTWEFSYFTSLAATMPIVYAAGRRLTQGSSWVDALNSEGGAGYADLAQLLGVRIPAASPFIRGGTWRTMRERFIMRNNPFELWKHWRHEALGEAGDAILKLCSQAANRIAPDHALQFPIELHRVCVDWVRLVERAAKHYAARNHTACVTEIRAGERLLDGLRPRLESIAAAGGSSGDPGRLERLKEKVRVAATRIEAIDAQAAYRPSFETIVHDFYIPGAQAAWRTGEDPPVKQVITAEP